VHESYAIPRYAQAELENTGIDPRTARQAFGRGLAPFGDDWLVAGSSPATISLYRRGITDAVRSVTLTRDIRNAIHGLELWPFDGAPPMPGAG
jgi:hypothetical protein